jgi:hypothetical protein
LGRSDLESKLSELDNKLDRTRSDLEMAIEKVRHDLGLKIAEGKAETIRWVVGVGFAQVAMILAVLRLFPSVHPLAAQTAAIRTGRIPLRL